ncbi:hypothetical protein BDV32DRAFT_120163 [Aspergillus pseudonomiae]|uniref:Uncharacterized protein n=1 Tax=Aspergillus pseudonomiae TaxID=1506151 RepID=A0A5N6I9M4_9EURO|nr:uncharacterized protein BDV37DRAFT_251690 [Aspergillus pseudonomiae]KAB8262460.1 hypothetical protein BDV32DRAFT_120163 [Aspergillus pseudonomiae]KAE8402834.1 hypothetical protein BDV37DRAFT_251690 [Aspergillus pseudonomiae]
MIGGCSACVYEYIRRLGRWDLSCWCTNVPDTSKVPVPNGNFMAAPVKFDLDRVLRVRDRHVYCHQHQSTRYRAGQALQ